MRRIAVVCVTVLAAFAVFATAGQNANSATYSKAVDNSDKERFAASKSWKKSDKGKGINGRGYLRAQPAKKGGHALFEVAIPTNGVYAVYVRWPETRGLNDRTPVGVETAYGTKWTEVDQRKDGGKWVRIGEFEMRKAEKFPIRISHNTKGKGDVVADAVKVEEVSSYEAPVSTAGTGTATPQEGTRTTSATTSDPVHVTAKRMAASFRKSGVRYKYAYCTSTLMSCTCFTKRVFARYGLSLSMSLPLQARAGRAISKASMRPGDLVIFDENLNGKIEDWDHVGIYVGRNAAGHQLVSHSSRYFNTTVTSEMRYLRGFAAVRRLV